ncbi:MAG: hypothetical protein IJP30_04370 [Clostridia bacterium]|nr:hypothetical protein [Clostridia bacterium]
MLISPDELWLPEGAAAVCALTDPVEDWQVLRPQLSMLPQPENASLVYLLAEQVLTLDLSISADLWVKGYQAAVLEALTQAGYALTKAAGDNLYFQKNAEQLPVAELIKALCEAGAQTDKNCLEALAAARAAVSAAAQEISLLREENRQFRYKLGRITNTWYGKCLLAVYRFLRKCKHLVTTGKWA